MRHQQLVKEQQCSVGGGGKGAGGACDSMAVAVTVKLSRWRQASATRLDVVQVRPGQAVGRGMHW